MPGQENEISSLRPDESIQKILISTPAHIVGTYEAPDLAIYHAWPPFNSGRRHWLHIEKSPLSRTALVVSFRTEPPSAAPGVVVPNYEPSGELMASLLSVLFGKRFDCHGPLQMTGHFGVPDLSTFNLPCDRSLKYNSNDIRSNYPISLNLSEVDRITEIIAGGEPSSTVMAFYAAAGFYRRSLQASEEDPELAYLHLITAGEILANASPYNDEAHLDENIGKLLQRIEAELKGGKKAANVLRAQFRSIKRRFVTTLLDLIDDQFFESHESRESWATFKRDDFEQRLAAAYDLRSRYVHTGQSFGRWITLHMSQFEVQIGNPVVADKDFAKALSRAPLFSGLERAMRYALLSFARQIGAKLGVD